MAITYIILLILIASFDLLINIERGKMKETKAGGTEGLR